MIKFFKMFFCKQNKITDEQIHQLISNLAYSFYTVRIKTNSNGNSLIDWYIAEKIILDSKLHKNRNKMTKQ